MKKIIAICLFVFLTFNLKAEISEYKAYNFYSSTNSGYSWSNWSNPKRCAVRILFDWSDMVMCIYSNRQQLYDIYQKSFDGYDGGERVVEYRFRDQDGDYGTMRLVIRNDGRSQVYIIFRNVRWCYDIVKV